MSTVTLCRPQSEHEAGLIQGLLDNAGVRSVQRRLNMWELDGVAGVAYGAWGEIWVDSADLERAVDVLAVLQSTAEPAGEAELAAEDLLWRRQQAAKRLRIRQFFWLSMLLPAAAFLLFMLAIPGESHELALLGLLPSATASGASPG